MQPSASPLATYVEPWAPAPQTHRDTLAPGAVAALSALLDEPAPVAASGDPLPPLWHWLYFQNWPPQQDLGADGHPTHGHFLPPVPDRQRMFAGGRCTITQPLLLGEQTERISSLDSVTVKKGRTGELLFVTQRTEFRQQDRCCLIEEQDIVYRSGPRSEQSAPAALDESAIPRSKEPWQLTVRPDPVLLFRFSALTANAHRIHYDLPYTRNEEGHPGLLVHGPLLALLMMELVRRNASSQQVRSLSYRLSSPVFAGECLLVGGTPASGRAEMHIASPRKSQHARAEVTFA